MVYFVKARDKEKLYPGLLIFLKVGFILIEITV